MWKKLIVLAALGYAGWWGYQKYLKPVGSPAFQEFQRYTGLLLTTNTITEAENMTGNATARIQTSQVAHALMEAMPITHAASWTAVVETPSEDGKKVDFTAEETIMFDPAGSTSTFGTMKMRLKWEGTMQRDGDYWRVMDYTYTILGSEKVT